jgi:hypothetical protein
MFLEGRIGGHMYTGNANGQFGLEMPQLKTSPILPLTILNTFIPINPSNASPIFLWLIQQFPNEMPQMDCAARPMTWQSLGNHLLLMINLPLLLLASGLRLLVLNDSPRGKVL